MLRRFLAAISLAAVMIFSFAGTAFAANRVNIRNGVIAGEKVGYYFTIPENIAEYIWAERNTPSNSSLLEQVTLICQAGPSEPSCPLISFYVYKRLAWKPSEGIVEMFRTNDYVFAFESYENRFDRGTYNYYTFRYCASLVGSAEKAGECVFLPPGQRREYKQTVFVNGKAMTQKVVLEESLYLVPFREIAETLGYTVEWEEAGRLVKIAGRGFKDSFAMTPTTISAHGYRVRMVSDRTYVSVGYFVKYLGISMEIDSNRNVYLSAK